MINILRPLFALLIVLVVGSAFADDAQTQLKNHLDRLDSFSADFSQRLINTEQVTVEPSLGRMVFKRPGQFRWIYETPYEQEIISNGETLWVYDKDLDQVTIRAAGEGLDHSPMTILDNPDSIAESYDVILLSENSVEQEIKLIPKYEDASFKYVLLVFSAQKLVAMEIYDNFDQYNSLSFHNIELNQQLDNDQFQFIPPTDVDIINATEQFN